MGFSMAYLDDAVGADELILGDPTGSGRHGCRRAVRGIEGSVESLADRVNYFGCDAAASDRGKNKVSGRFFNGMKSWRR